jgi:GNAT superfamily N-acetyltransferase
MSIRIEVFKGEETQPYIPVLSEMSIEAFHNFPYLYAGSREDTVAYTQGYSHGLLIVAFKHEAIVGIYPGMPMNAPNVFLEQWSEKLAERGIDVSKCFYAGALIVKPLLQKQGIGSQLIRRLIQETKEMSFSTMMGITSVRPLNHPLCPPNYFDTDQLWEKYGFEKTSIVFSTTWPTLQEDGSIKEETNEVACWINPLK